MVKKLVSYVAVAATVIGSAVLPSMADDSTAGKVLGFPFKATGSALSTVWGVPLGMTKGGVEGGMKTTKYVAGKLGNEECPVRLAAASVIGGPFGVVGGAAYGSVVGAIHGAKTGYEHPFSMESFRFKED
jgi:hypothetical protein